jgi:hypothetical protein
MSEDRKEPGWWKVYTFLFPVYPLSLVMILVTSIAFATVPRLQRFTPHDFFHVWKVQPSLGIGLFLMLSANFALDIWAYAGKGSPGKDAMMEQTIWHMLYVGLREEPIYNWLMVYITASALNVINKYIPLRTVLEPILTGETYPLVGVPRENWWAMMVAFIFVSLCFGWHHVKWRDPKLTRWQKIHWFLSVAAKGMSLAMINYFFGSIAAILLHSSFDAAIKLITLRKQQS